MCILERSKPRCRSALFLLVGAGLTACTVGPDFTPPEVPKVSQYTAGSLPAQTAEAEGIRQQIQPTAQLPSDWWKLFESPALNNAVADGIEQSPSIASAAANLKEAEDLLRSGQGIFYPQVTGSAGLSRQSPSQFATPLKFKEGTFNLLSLAGTVSYSLDIFGGERRQVEALGAEVEYQRNIARATSLALATNIANAFIALAAYQAELNATNDIIGLEQREVALALVQAKAGTGTYAAELSLQSQLQATEAIIPTLEQKIAQTQDLLAILEGKTPSELHPTSIAFDELSLPRTLPVSLPSSLVRQRPDILEAESLVHAASAKIGVATAAMLPNITLNGTLGYSSTNASSLFSGPSNLWSVGAGLTQPIFEGGALYYQRKAAIDAYQAASADYRQAVLAAFQQVADTLLGLQHDADAVATAQEAVKTAKRSLDLVRVNYTAGIATYSDVLLANTQYGQARISLIQNQASRYQDTVALFAALGGGWWNDSTKSADVATNLSEIAIP